MNKKKENFKSKPVAELSTGTKSVNIFKKVDPDGELGNIDENGDELVMVRNKNHPNYSHFKKNLLIEDKDDIPDLSNCINIMDIVDEDKFNQSKRNSLRIGKSNLPKPIKTETISNNGNIKSSINTKLIDNEKQKNYVDVNDLQPKDPEPQELKNKSSNDFNKSISNATSFDYSLDIANFKLKAIAIIKIIDGDNRYTLYRLNGEMTDGTKLKTTDISAYDFQNKAWIHKNLGIQCRIGPSEDAYRIISSELSDQFRSVEVIYLYKQVGWYETRFGYIYSQGNQPIGNCADNVVCECSKYIEVNLKLSKKEAFYHAMEMLDIAPKKTTHVLLSFTILGLLRQLFEDSGNPPRFLVWMVAETGSYKTTLAKEFSIIFNRTKNELTASFKDTAASLEVKASEYKDSVLIADDFYPATSSLERRNLFLAADHLIRLFGDNISKARMNSRMEKQKEYKPNGVCLVSAEDTHGSTSSRSRCLHLYLDKNSVDLETLSFCQDRPKHFSTFIFNFLKYISANYESYVKDIKKRVKNYRKEFRNSFKHGRLLDSYILLLVSFEIFQEYGCYINAINKDEKINECNLASENFWELVTDMTYDIYSDEPGILYAKAVDELVSSCKISLSKSNDHNTERNGWDIDDHYYLYPDLMLAEVVKFYNDQGRKYSASKVKSHMALDSLGLIEKDGNKRTVKKSFYGTARKRYLVIEKNKLNDLLLNF
jgi:hypothetical protein